MFNLSIVHVLYVIDYTPKWSQITKWFRVKKQLSLFELFAFGILYIHLYSYFCFRFISVLDFQGDDGWIGVHHPSIHPGVKEMLCSTSEKWQGAGFLLQDLKTVNKNIGFTEFHSLCIKTFIVCDSAQTVKNYRVPIF